MAREARQHVSPSPGTPGEGRGGGFFFVHFPKHRRLYLVTMFAKNEKDNLTPAERNAVKALVGRINDALDAGARYA